MVRQGADKDEGGFWRRLRWGLGKTRSRLAEGVGTLLLGSKEIDQAVLDDLEAALLGTDVGVETTQKVMESLKSRVSRRQLNDAEALHHALQEELTAVLEPVERPFVVAADKRPFVMLVVGVNGSGKTTTIGKIASQLKAEGHSLLLAAGDTFRAAAIEQLQRWGERSGVGVIAQQQGADSASVVYDAVEAARARDVDVLIADTAGRLQAKTNLMQELAKVKRVVSRLEPEAPHEVLLVLDATVGQNALGQVKEFDAAIGVTGLAITKLDGTARAGVLFAIAERTSLPVYFIGVGEQLEDLRPFDARDFVAALLARDPE